MNFTSNSSLIKPGFLIRIAAKAEIINCFGYVQTDYRINPSGTNTGILTH